MLMIPETQYNDAFALADNHSVSTLLLAIAVAQANNGREFVEDMLADLPLLEMAPNLGTVQTQALALWVGATIDCMHDEISSALFPDRLSNSGDKMLDIMEHFINLVTKHKNFNSTVQMTLR